VWLLRCLVILLPQLVPSNFTGIHVPRILTKPVIKTYLICNRMCVARYDIAPAKFRLFYSVLLKTRKENHDQNDDVTNLTLAGHVWKALARLEREKRKENVSVSGKAQLGCPKRKSPIEEDFTINIRTTDSVTEEIACALFRVSRRFLWRNRVYSAMASDCCFVPAVIAWTTICRCLINVTWRCRSR